MRPEYIINLEQKEGIFSVMGMGEIETNLERYFREKKTTIVYSESTNNKGVITWWEIIYETAQKFYVHLSHKLKEETDKWSMSIYYKPEQYKELLFFINQLNKNIQNATTNDSGIKTKN